MIRVHSKTKAHSSPFFFFFFHVRLFSIKFRFFFVLFTWFWFDIIDRLFPLNIPIFSTYTSCFSCRPLIWARSIFALIDWISVWLRSNIFMTLDTILFPMIHLIIFWFLSIRFRPPNNRFYAKSFSNFPTFFLFMFVVMNWKQQVSYHVPSINQISNAVIRIAEYLIFVFRPYFSFSFLFGRNSLATKTQLKNDHWKIVVVQWTFGD